MPGLDYDWTFVLHDSQALRNWSVAVAEMTVSALATGTSVEAWMSAFARIRCAQIVSAWHSALPDPLRDKVTLVQLGSAARREDLLGSDLDHAVLASDEDSAAAVVPHLYTFIRVMSSVLCPPCEGFVMATNPRWIGTEASWQTRVQQYLSHPDWDHARYLFMLVDSRVHARAREWDEVVLPVRTAIESSSFLRWEMAHLGIRGTVGLGPFGRVVLDQVGERKVFSVKERLVAPMVHSIRLLAMSAGITRLSTRERCAELAALGVLTQGEATEVMAAVSFAWSLRLRSHAKAVLDGNPLRDWVDAGRLSQEEQAELREHLRVAKELEHMVCRRFPKPR
ncbi:putative nucleotidyltransferase substrate binding domain-containing protein [Alicyclobacillus sp. ALC3]|uniref:putative nucleotidyltransferase substrate binding domain-containing protein n=1 Tax=Alicyclobacillus sp. ALC3 TaxID=2796143 RepID=UPI0023781951|nr:putative nucleotidyltransferase substrate binding domain-containing protein [Alicyclobacillus sp. ALC3]